MSLFDRLDAMASRTVDRVNATPFTLHPMRRAPNGRAEVDPDRPVTTGRAIFDMQPQLAPVEFGARDRSGNALHSLVSAEGPCASIDRAQFAGADQEPRQGDHIDFGPKGAFTVAGVKRDGLSRLELSLTPVRND